MRTVVARNSLLRSIQHSIANKQLSAVDVTKAYLQQIHSVEQQLNSFLTVNQDYALQQAAAVDAAIAHGDSIGVLAGVPIAIKDNICTAGLRTTAGSQVLDAYLPPFDATAVARLRAAGAVLVGKTNMDEFGMGSTTENSGYKPSYGRVSRYGLIAYGSSLDVVGPLATCVEDAALLLNVIAGADSADATCSKEAVGDFTAGLQPADQLGSQPLQGVRVGLIQETLGEGVDAGVSAAINGAVLHMQQLGAQVDEVSLPTFAAGLPAYYVLALSEASSNLSRYDGVRYGLRAGDAAADLKDMYSTTRGEGLGPEVKRRILMGTYALSAGYYDAYYKRAQQVRTLVQQEMQAVLRRYDVLICPTAPTAAYKIGDKSSDPLAMYKGDLMTVNLNLSGLPGIVVPCGFVNEAGVQLPVGLQLIGPMFGEQQLLKIAHAYEQTALTSAAVSSLSDVLAQRLIGGKYNPLRTLKMALWGLLFGAPSAHYWHHYVQKWFAGKADTAETVVQKVLLDQLTFGPVYNFCFMAYTSMMVWIPVGLINYRYVPLQFRVLFANIIALFW
eukprot:gene6114-6353_t